MGPWERLARPGLLGDWHTCRTPHTPRYTVEHGQRQDDEHTEPVCPQWGPIRLARKTARADTVQQIRTATATSVDDKQTSR